MGDAEKPSPEAAKAPQATKKEDFLMPLLVWIVIGLLLGGAAYVLLFSSAPPPVVKPPVNNTVVIPPSNTTKLAKAAVTLISEPSCPECNSTSALLAQIISVGPQMNLTISGVTQLARGSPDADAFIAKYSITKLPALVMTKDAENSASFTSAWANVGTRGADGSFIYQETYPPYYDLATGKTVGIVGLTVIPASNCADCFNTSKLVESLAGSSVRMVFSGETVLDAGSADAKALMAKYNITRLPAMFLSPEAAAYPPVAQGWSQLGTIEPDGWYVYRSTMPPYADLLKNGSVVGRVSIIELTDPSCTACYDVNTQYTSLVQSLGMAFSNRTAYNITSTEGKKLIVKYNITEVPTILLSPDAFFYPAVNQSWSQIGTKEKDGWLVYRNLSNMGVVYKDLTTGNVTGSVAAGG